MSMGQLRCDIDGYAERQDREQDLDRDPSGSVSSHRDADAVRRSPTLYAVAERVTPAGRLS
jgi:hypothetical protein